MKKMTRKRQRIMSNKLLIDIFGSQDIVKWDAEKAFKKLEKKEP
jgi:hypothetical protein